MKEIISRAKTDEEYNESTRGVVKGGQTGTIPGARHTIGALNTSRASNQKKFNILALLVPEILIFIGEKLVIFSILQNQY